VLQSVIATTDTDGKRLATALGISEQMISSVNSGEKPKRVVRDLLKSKKLI
jgi:soluble P-type ATPase